MLGNPQISLRQVGEGSPVVTWGPTGRDIYDHGEGFFLDFPGSALEPGCIYEADNERYTAGLEPTVYANIVTQPDRPGFIVVQYWLYWYFNAWNNVHESDWEFVQIVFSADTVEEALTQAPVEVGYAQHEGGERAAWDSDKLERVGDRPVVYSSQRSHASYFKPAMMVGRGASEGFGCDNTTGPSTRIDPEAVLIPEPRTGIDDRFAWVDFSGRWGEPHGTPNNGPTGPSTKPQWTEPMTWQDGLRETSFILPSDEAVGLELATSFCTIVGFGSAQFIDFSRSPVRLLLFVGSAVIAMWWLIGRTSWRQVSPVPLVKARKAGEIFVAVLGVIRSNPRQMLGLALVPVPMSLVAAIISVAWSTPSGNGANASFAVVVVSLIASGVWSALSSSLVTAGASHMLNWSDRSAWSWRQSGHVVFRQWRTLIPVVVVMALVILGLLFTVVLIPIALWLLVRWLFVSSVLTVEAVTGRAALARSAELIRGRWWHTAATALLAVAAFGGIGFVVGMVLLVAVPAIPLAALAVIVAVINAVGLVPVSLSLVYLYGDAVAEHDQLERADA